MKLRSLVVPLAAAVLAAAAVALPAVAGTSSSREKRLEARIRTLMNQVTNYHSALNATGANLGIARVDLAQAKKDLAASQASVTQLQGQVNGLQAQIAADGGDTSGLQARLNAAQADLASTKTALTNAQTSNTTLHGQVDSLTAQLASANSQTVQAAIQQMTPAQAFSLLDALRGRFPTNSLTWSASLYTSGTYQSYTFTYSP